MKRVRTAARRFFRKKRTGSPAQSESDSQKKILGVEKKEEVAIEVEDRKDEGDVGHANKGAIRRGKIGAAVSEMNLNFDEVGVPAVEFYSPQPSRPIRIPERIRPFYDWDDYPVRFGLGSSLTPSRLRHVMGYENLAEAPLDDSPWGTDEQGYPMSPQPRSRLRRVKRSYNLAEDFKEALEEQETVQRNQKVAEENALKGLDVNGNQIIEEHPDTFMIFYMDDV